MPGPKTDLTHELAVLLVQQHGSIKAAARDSGYSYSTMHKYYNQGTQNDPAQHPEKYLCPKHRSYRAVRQPSSDCPDCWIAWEDKLKAGEALPRSERLILEDRIKSLEKRLREADKEELTTQKVSAYFFDLKDREIEIPDWMMKMGPEPGYPNAPGVPVTNWSDWHFGEIVDPNKVEGANEFNLDVFDRRLRRLVERTVDLAFNHMTNPRYEGMVINLGGDMISGNIHEELALTNELETIPAVLELAGKIIWAFDRLLEHFPELFVPTSVGNHGRNTQKPNAKMAVHTSFDWMLYKILEMHYAKDQRVTFFIPDGFDAYYRVFDHRILLTHGDRLGARGGDGFIGVIGPIMRGAYKLRLSYAARGREFDTLMLGHYHNEINLPGLRVNNALKGYDEWAMSMRFVPTAPSQDFFFIHPKRGVTSSWPIQLEDPKHNFDDQPWTSWRS
jgi:hypothetical protein